MTESSKIPLHVRVLGYREDGEWVALALDMDLHGCGKTFEDALKELSECVDVQVSAALEKGNLGLLHFPAEKKYFGMYYDTLLKKASGEDVVDQEDTTVLSHLVKNLVSEREGGESAEQLAFG